MPALHRGGLTISQYFKDVPSLFPCLIETICVSVIQALAVRRRRAPRELTRDAVERALNEQVAGGNDEMKKKLARLE